MVFLTHCHAGGEFCSYNLQTAHVIHAQDFRACAVPNLYTLEFDIDLCARILFHPPRTCCLTGPSPFQQHWCTFPSARQYGAMKITVKTVDAASAEIEVTEEVGEQKMATLYFGGRYGANMICFSISIRRRLFVSSS